MYSMPKAKENPMLVITNASNVDEKAIGKIKSIAWVFPGNIHTPNMVKIVRD